MNKSIRHLRATSAEWAAHDIVIPEGEIALEKMPSGRIRARIGNGADHFSALPAIDGEAKRPRDTALTLSHGVIYRLGTVEALSVALPKAPDDDFYCEISFDCGKDAAEFDTDTAIRFSGDDIAGEQLIPRADTHYNLFIFFDGEYQGVARGIPNA